MIWELLLITALALALGWTSRIWWSRSGLQLFGYCPECLGPAVGACDREVDGIAVEAVYRHYKQGKLYVTHEVARHTERDELLVIYSSKPGEVWARPVEAWKEEVTWPDGVRRPRFVRVRDQQEVAGPSTSTT